MSGIFNPLQNNNQLTIDYATYELSLVLASGSPLVLEAGGFNINLGTGIINNAGAIEVNIDNTYIIENSGVLSINLTENYTWTGQHQFTNTTDYTIILAAELGNIYGALTLPGSAAFSLLNNLVFDAGVGTGGYNPLGWDAISNFAHNYRVYASYSAGSTYTFSNAGANVANIIGGGLSYNVEGSTASIPSPHRVGFNVNAGATGGSTGIGVLVSNAALTLGSTYDLSGGSAVDTLLGFGVFGSSSGYCSGVLDFTAYGGNTAYVYFFVQGTNYGHYINNGELWVIH